MEMNIHTILLTGHFNNLKLRTQEHSLVTDRMINRNKFYKQRIALANSEFIELFSKLPIVYVHFLQYVDYLRHFNKTFYNIHRKKVIISKNYNTLEWQILLIWRHFSVLTTITLANDGRFCLGFIYNTKIYIHCLMILHIKSLLKLVYFHEISMIVVVDELSSITDISIINHNAFDCFWI